MRKELTLDSAIYAHAHRRDVFYASSTGDQRWPHYEYGLSPAKWNAFLEGPRWIEVADKPACELPEEVDACFPLNFENRHDLHITHKALTALHRHWQEQSRQQDAYHEARLATAYEEIKALQAKVERMENHCHPMSMDSKLKMAGPSYPTSTAKEGE